MMFPVSAIALSVVVNGTTLRSYQPAFLRSGRVVAPVEPFLTTVTASIESSGKVLIVRWGDRFAQVPLRQAPHPGDFPSIFVEIGPVLRTLGISASYDPARRTLYVQTRRIPLTTPTPFNPAVPYATPRVVFTPSPQPTPVPKIMGTPLPRRTPLPVETSIPVHAFHVHPKLVFAPRSQEALQLHVVNRFKGNGMNSLSCNYGEYMLVTLPNHQLARVEKRLSEICGIRKRS
jgi:hypothetical protein